TNSDGPSPRRPVRTQAHCASEDRSPPSASPPPPTNRMSSAPEPPITNARPFAAGCSWISTAAWLPLRGTKNDTTSRGPGALAVNTHEGAGLNAPYELDTQPWS